MFSVAKRVSTCAEQEDLEKQLQEGINDYFSNSNEQSKQNILTLLELKQPTEETIKGQINGLLAIAKDVVKTGHQVAKIFYGIPSPRLEACNWFGSQYWGKGKHLDYEMLVATGNQLILETKI